MTPGELAFEKGRGDLTAAQRAAMKVVEQLVKRGVAGTAWLAIRELWHYDEGKPTEHVVFEHSEQFSDEERNQIRRERREAMERMAAARRNADETAD